MPFPVRKAYESFVDLLFPRGVACALCGADLDEPGVLCPECEPKLPPVQGVVCPGCGRQCSGEERLCKMCRTYGPASDGGFAAHDYAGDVRGLLIAFKFSGRTGLRGLFSHTMLQTVREAGVADEIDCVVPVPMHWRRKFHRGYNQSELLAQWIAEGLEKPLVRGVLARPVYTLPSAQGGGGPAGRLQNALRSYQPGKGTMQGKTVLLVDDIMTTGATIRACGAVLKSMGAVRVYSVVAAAVPE